jgi:predicted ATPase
VSGVYTDINTVTEESFKRTSEVVCANFSSRFIYNHLIETYQGYGYELIEVPKDTLDNRILFILEFLNNFQV